MSDADNAGAAKKLAATGEKVTVEPSEIYKEAGIGSTVKEAGIRDLGPLQRVGLKLAGWVFTYIAVATAVIAAVSFWPPITLPSMPVIPANLTAEAASNLKASLDTYKQAVDLTQQLHKMQTDRMLSLFQLVIASTAVPAFAAILGYIFGSRKSGAE